MFPWKASFRGLTAVVRALVDAPRELQAEDTFPPRGRLDLVLCDLSLAGGESGLEVVGRLRGEHGSELACAFITGESAPERISEVRASGIPIAFKPTKPGKLRALVEHLLPSR